MGRQHASWVESMLHGPQACFNGSKARLSALQPDWTHDRQIGSTIARLVQLAPLTLQRAPFVSERLDLYALHGQLERDWTTDSQTGRTITRLEALSPDWCSGRTIARLGAL